MKKQQYIKPQASVIIIQNTLLTDASPNRYNGGNTIKFDPDSMEGGEGTDAASRDGGWDEW